MQAAKLGDLAFLLLWWTADRGDPLILNSEVVRAAVTITTSKLVAGPLPHTNGRLDGNCPGGS
jgi:hypothetical protein